MGKLAWFYDSECKKRVGALTSIGFDDVVEAGEKVEKVFYIKNITRDEIDKIKITVEDSEVKVLQESNSLLPNQSMAIHFVFHPSETREDALQSVVDIRLRVIKKPTPRRV